LSSPESESNPTWVGVYGRKDFYSGRCKLQGCRSLEWTATVVIMDGRDELE